MSRLIDNEPAVAPELLKELISKQFKAESGNMLKQLKNMSGGAPRGASLKKKSPTLTKQRTSKKQKSSHTPHTPKSSIQKTNSAATKPTKGKKTAESLPGAIKGPRPKVKFNHASKQKSNFKSKNSMHRKKK